MTEPRLRILEILRRTGEYLARAGIESSRLDAEVLLAHVLHVPRIQLYAQHDRPLEPGELDRYRALVRRRADREPVAYLTGAKEFHSLAFAVSPAVLIPRPETEHLVDRAVELAAALEAPALLDVGTGSGCIAIAWAVSVPGGRFTATDLSGEALAVARENAATHGVADRGEFLEGELFEPAGGCGPFDLVVSNPPYVRADEAVDPECRREPALAVFGEGEPIGIYRRLLAGAPARLAPGGHLLLELPGERAEEIAALAPPPLEVVEIVRDYGDLPRVLVARVSPPRPSGTRS